MEIGVVACFSSAEGEAPKRDAVKQRKNRRKNDGNIMENGRWTDI